MGCLELAGAIYDTFGLDVRAELSLRPDKRIGSEEGWDRMEAALASALRTAGWKCAVNPGDGAFYAPKIDLHMTDSIGRSWQVAQDSARRLHARAAGRDLYIARTSSSTPS